MLGSEAAWAPHREDAPHLNDGREPFGGRRAEPVGPSHDDGLVTDGQLLELGRRVDPAGRVDVAQHRLVTGACVELDGPVGRAAFGAEPVERPVGAGLALVELGDAVCVDFAEHEKRALAPCQAKNESESERAHGTSEAVGPQPTTTASPVEPTAPGHIPTRLSDFNRRDYPAGDPDRPVVSDTPNPRCWRSVSGGYERDMGPLGLAHVTWGGRWDVRPGRELPAVAWGFEEFPARAMRAANRWIREHDGRVEA